MDGQAKIVFPLILAIKFQSLILALTGDLHTILIMTDTRYCAGGGGISGVGGAKVKLLLDVLRNTLELLPTARDRNRLLSSLMGTWRDYLAALYDDTDPLEAG